MPTPPLNFDPYLNTCHREESPDEPILPSDDAEED